MVAVVPAIIYLDDWGRKPLLKCESTTPSQALAAAYSSYSDSRCNCNMCVAWTCFSDGTRAEGPSNEATDGFVDLAWAR